MEKNTKLLDECFKEVKLFNGGKLKNYFKENNITQTEIADKLNLKRNSRIAELFSGIEHKKLLKLICNEYSLNYNDYYKDFEEPKYMKMVRSKINSLSETLTLVQIAGMSEISVSTLSNIINCKTYICHINTANKILNIEENKSSLNKILDNNIKNIVSESIYEKLLNDSKTLGSMEEALKFIINKHYYNK